MNKRGRRPGTVVSFWTEEELEYMRRMYATTSNKDLAEYLGRPYSSIGSKAYHMRLLKDPNFINSLETRFRAGCNHDKRREIGAERVNTRGYLVRKTNHGPIHGKRWEFVHVLVWEAAHGPVPPKHAVWFKDGNKANICLENLELVSFAKSIHRNGIAQYPSELISLMRLNKKLQRQIQKDHDNEEDK